MVGLGLVARQDLPLSQLDVVAFSWSSRSVQTAWLGGSNLKQVRHCTHMRKEERSRSSCLQCTSPDELVVAMPLSYLGQLCMKVWFVFAWIH